MFSPHYAAARRRQPAAEPLAHCGVNVALYGPSGRWSFTEYGAAHLARSRSTLCLGASHWTWDDAGALCIELDERTSPWPGQICGRLRLRPRGPAPTPHTLDLDGAHHWWPVAPCADLEVRLSDPAVHFDGPGYHDANWGSAPLEADFSHWDWQRACHLDATTVHYTARLRDGTDTALHLHYGADGSVRALPPPPTAPLPTSRWRLGGRAHGVLTACENLEDTPFYRRARLQLQDGGAVLHEYLDLRRFRRRWVQHLLRYRMRRQR